MIHQQVKGVVHRKPFLSKVKESEANRFEAAFETLFIDRDFSVITTWAKPIAFFRRIYGNVRS